VQFNDNRIDSSVCTIIRQDILGIFVPLNNRFRVAIPSCITFLAADAGFFSKFRMNSVGQLALSSCVNQYSFCLVRWVNSSSLEAAVPCSNNVKLIRKKNIILTTWQTLEQEPGLEPHFTVLILIKRIP